MITIAVLLAPFVQLGPSFYISIGTLLAIILIAKMPTLLAPITAEDLGVRALACSGLFISLLTYAPSDLSHATLRIFREGLAFIAMTSALYVIADRRVTLATGRQRFVVAATIAGLFALALTQQFALSRGSYFGFPKSWFAQNADTVPDLLALKYSRLRPTGTLGEPSYFGFLSLSLFMMAFGYARRYRLMAFCAMVAVLTGLLSRSFSFVIALSFVGFVVVASARQNRSRQVTLLLPGLVASAVVIFLIVQQRFLGATTDTSAYARVIGPPVVVGPFLRDHPFGVNFADLPRVLESYTSGVGFHGSEFLHNSLFNMIFCYGIFAVPIWYFLFFRIRDPILNSYVFICAFFNGAYLSVDKASIIILTAYIYTSGTFRSPNRPLSEGGVTQPIQQPIFVSNGTS